MAINDGKDYGPVIPMFRSHQKEKTSLLSDAAALRTDNDSMLKKHQQLEKDLARSVC